MVHCRSLLTGRKNETSRPIGSLKQTLPAGNKARVYCIYNLPANTSQETRFTEAYSPTTRNQAQYQPALTSSLQPPQLDRDTQPCLHQRHPSETPLPSPPSETPHPLQKHKTPAHRLPVPTQTPRSTQPPNPALPKLAAPIIIIIITTTTTTTNPQTQT
jgi:hypothetical protein